MAEVRFQVDDKFMEDLQKHLQTTKATDVVKEALTVLNWAVKEKAKGREVLSGKLSADREDAQGLVRLATPGLDNVRVPE